MLNLSSFSEKKRNNIELIEILRYPVCLTERWRMYSNFEGRSEAQRFCCMFNFLTQNHFLQKSSNVSTTSSPRAVQKCPFHPGVSNSLSWGSAQNYQRFDLPVLYLQLTADLYPGGAPVRTGCPKEFPSNVSNVRRVLSWWLSQGGSYYYDYEAPWLSTTYSLYILHYILDFDD